MGLFSAYDLLLSTGIKWFTQICVKSTKSVTVYKCLKKNLPQIKKKMHGLHSKCSILDVAWVLNAVKCALT